jgi:benzoyl-CoA 2,3-dioxygenase component A
MDASDVIFIKQHLIDPEICIRCNTCEATCPVSAITHDSNNYVVDASKCNLCMACISPCPTGSIDNWRTMPKVKAYSIEEQFGWESLPGELSEAELAEAAGSEEAAVIPQPVAAPSPGIEPGETTFRSADYGATVPPWSAAHA